MAALKGWRAKKIMELVSQSENENIMGQPHPVQMREDNFYPLNENIENISPNNSDSNSILNITQSQYIEPVNNEQVLELLDYQKDENNDETSIMVHSLVADYQSDKQDESSSSSTSTSSSSSSSDYSSDSDNSSPEKCNDQNTIEELRDLKNKNSCIDIPGGEENSPHSIECKKNECQCANKFNSKQEKELEVNLNYTVSPHYTDESEVDLSDDDPTYEYTKVKSKKPRNFFFQPSKSLSSSSSSSCLSDSSTSTETTTKKKGRKRRRNPGKWRQNKAKLLRNQGEAYTSISKSGKQVPSRCLKPPCTEKCKLKCSETINTDERYEVFSAFWELGDLYKQRAYIRSCMEDITPKYKYSNAEKPRQPNKAYHLTVHNRRIRVCKTFFKSTLDISDRMILTTQQKTNDSGIVLEDMRGKHHNHKTISPDIIKDIKNHINSIPRVESHYLRANTTKEYIEGGKTIKDLYTHFETQQKQNQKETGNYAAYYKIFTTEFNLGFFKPKKDQCDLCLSYQNSNNDQRKELQDKYDKHLEERTLCREEIKTDRTNLSKDNKVVIYDLQAVLQSPRGNISAFYYKSKLNSYNLTLTELTKLKQGSTQGKKKAIKEQGYENVHCYFWTESDAKRGANEIGSCVWKYLEEICKDSEEYINVTFYSDNCCGQNKNKYMTSLYMYAVTNLNFQTITHKFLIRGHTHNSADSVHSLIEKEVTKNLNSGPIYTPDQYIPLIKNAKKSKPPIKLHELTFDCFGDMKQLQEEWGYNFSMDEDGNNVNWNDMKVLKVTKEKPFAFLFKTSYNEQTYREVNVRNKRKKMTSEKDIHIKNAYTEKQALSQNKKKDLEELIKKGLIPSYYANYYNSIL